MLRLQGLLQNTIDISDEIADLLDSLKFPPLRFIFATLWIVTIVNICLIVIGGGFRGIIIGLTAGWLFWIIVMIKIVNHIIKEEYFMNWSKRYFYIALVIFHEMFFVAIYLKTRDKNKKE